MPPPSAARSDAPGVEADLRAFEKRLLWTEEELRAQLRQLPESDAGAGAGANPRRSPGGLPTRTEAEGRLSGDQARAVQGVADVVRTFGAVPLTCKLRGVSSPGHVSALEIAGAVTPTPPTGAGIVVDAPTRDSVLLIEEDRLRDLRPALLAQPGGKFRAKFDQALSRVPGGDSALAGTLEQLLQAEAEPSRLLLVQELGGVKGEAAGAALARRAAYDLSPRVRAAAVAALKDRPPEQFREVLLEALRHPWPPAADHAAWALAAVGDEQAIPRLEALLDEPDPKEPFYDESQHEYVVREVVRVNHLRNCFLCHPPSTSPADPLRGQVPKPGRALPVLPNGYYQDSTGPFVRGDVTFLRPDFSVRQPVDHADPWPEDQRFDYLIRTRLAESQEGNSTSQTMSGDYPQREAVFFALRALKSGKRPAAP